MVATVDGNSVGLTASGTGGLSELVSNLREDACQYGYLRVISGDTESRRAKFVFISWVGDKVGALKRAKTSVQKAEVKKTLRDFTVEVHGETLDELEESAIMTKVRKAGGAGTKKQILIFLTSFFRLFWKPPPINFLFFGCFNKVFCTLKIESFSFHFLFR